MGVGEQGVVGGVEALEVGSFGGVEYEFVNEGGLVLRRCWLCWMALVCMCLFLVDFVGFLFNNFAYCDEVLEQLRGV